MSANPHSVVGILGRGQEERGGGIHLNLGGWPVPDLVASAHSLEHAPCQDAGAKPCMYG